MSNKNKHNKTIGSSIDRSDERLKVSGEFFTPSPLGWRLLMKYPLEFLKIFIGKF